MFNSVLSDGSWSMVMQTSDNSINNPYNVGADQYPFYSNEEVSPATMKEKPSIWNDADTLSSYRLSRASAPAPNTLVPLDATGLVPLATIPPLAGSSAIIGATGTYAALKAAPLAGVYFAWDTDIGQGALVLMTNIAGIGDAGWLVVAGG